MRKIALFALFLSLFILPFLTSAQCPEIDAEIIQVCSEDSEVVLKIDISGGENPYNLRWESDGTSGQEVFSIGSGVLYLPISTNFLISIEDNNACIDTVYHELLPITPNYDLDVTVNNTFCGHCAGSIMLVANGGNSPYSIEGQYGFEATFTDTILIDNLCAGAYNFDISDSLGCTQIIYINVDSDDAPNITSLEILPNTCVNGQNGSISFEVEGISPFIYSWSGPNGFSDTTITSGISNLASGEYLLVITDGNECSNLFSYEIETIQSEDIFEIRSVDATCTTGGTISFEVIQGENPPYTFTVQDMDGNLYEGQDLSAGEYYACIADASGCINQCETIFIQSSIALNLTSTLANCDNTGGFATVNVLSGADVPSFEWSNGQIGDTLLDVAAGWYSVTVTDDSTGCRTHQNIEVELDPTCYVSISGYVYLDPEMSDCAEDEATIPGEYVLVELSNGAIDFTDENGYYEFQIEAGTYEVMVNLENSSYDALCIDPISINIPNYGDASTDNNFWIEYAAVENLAVQLYAGPVRPGFAQTVIAYVFNLGVAPSDGVLSFTHDSLQNFFTSIPSGYDYDEASTTISWAFENLLPGTYEKFVIELDLPATIALGTLINYSLVADPIASDIYPADNIEERVIAVTGSYDPNDKQVSPTGEGDEGVISRADSMLTYQVRFQNTGTDTAFTVVVLDEIDEDLDISTVRPGPSSHPYKLNVLDGNVLEFRFENIMLPDSFINEPASNGYVLFDIKTKRDLSWGTKIENTAAIYFDFNEPIITNTTVNTLRQPTNVKNLITLNLPLEISPNPGNGSSIVKFSLEEPTQVDLALFDTRGHLIRQYLNKEQLQSGLHQVRFEETELPQGIYFVALKTENGMTGMEKLVKIE